MGIASLENICTGFLEAGMNPQTPAAIVENATLKTQRKFIGTLETLFELSQRNHVVSPSVVIIGNVCTLSDKLGAWHQSKK
jgi:uroporphyrinogen III methyltransferase/synthase